MSSIYGFDEESVERLRAMLAAYEAGRLLKKLDVKPSMNRPPVETYVALTTDDIPACDGTFPGSGLCTLLSLDLDTEGLNDVSVDVPCWNLSALEIPVNTYVVLIREGIGGSYFLLPGGSFGAGSGSGDGSGSGSGVPDDPSCSVVRCFQMVQDVCLQNGVLYKDIVHVTWTPTGFKLCDACPSGSGSGSGSGGSHSGGGNTVSFSCCADVLLPFTVHVTISDSTCECLNGTWSVDWDGSGGWGGFEIPQGACGDEFFSIYVTCVGGFVYVYTGCVGTSEHAENIAVITSFTCVPFFAAGTGAQGSEANGEACCPFGTTFSVIVTE